MLNSKLTTFILMNAFFASTVWAAPQPLHLKPLRLAGYDLQVDCHLLGQSQKCVLDLGSEYSLVPNYDATYVQLPVHQILHLATPLASSETLPCETRKIPNLNILGRTFNEMEVGFCSPYQDGLAILGAPVFKDGIFSFDFDKMEFDFLSNETTLKGASPLTQGPTGIILIDVTIEGRTYAAAVDSGASQSTFDVYLLQKHPRIFQQFAKNQFDAPLVQFKNIFINGQTYSGFGAGGDLSNLSHLIRSPRRIEMVIGADIMSQGNWVFDLRKKLWTVKKNRLHTFWDQIEPLIQQQFLKISKADASRVPDLFWLSLTGDFGPWQNQKTFFGLGDCVKAEYTLSLVELQNQTALSLEEITDLNSRLNNRFACAEIKLN